MVCSGICCVGSLLLVFSHLFIGRTSALTVTLTSSVEQVGRQVACPGEVVTFTCMVDDGTVLSWTAEPYITMMDPIRFIVSDPVGLTGMDDGGQFRARLTSVQQSGMFGDLTSELTVNASEILGGTVIQCLATAAVLINKTLALAAPPSPLQQPSYSVSQYQLTNFTAVVQWESPASDGGVDIDSYTLTGAGITAPLTVLSNEPLMVTLTLSYNEMHMVHITASNCAASVVTIHEVSCGSPTPPPRGSLGDLTSLQEGAMVTFQCSPGLVPSQQNMSVCAANGRWTPDPAELECRADCGDPSLPVNGVVMANDSTLEGSQTLFQCSPGFVPSQQMMSVCMADGNWTPNPAGLECGADCGIPVIIDGSVNYTTYTTVEGSTATYQCDTGLIPEGVITAVCMANGEWVPDPAEVGCRPPATCSRNPPSPTGGSVNSTNNIEGSEATFQCDTGLVPDELFTAVCTASGEWVLNPGDLSCNQPIPDSQGLSTVQTVGISVIISSIVSFTAGLLVALVIAYCYIRQQKTNQYSPNEPKQPAPMYEDVSMDVRRDIELKENVAYRVVGQ